MDSSKPQTPAPLLNPRDRRRLLGLIATLMLVLYSMKATSDPDFWSWMFPPDAAPEAGEATPTDSQPQVDFTIAPDDSDRPQGKPDTVGSVPPDDAETWRSNDTGKRDLKSDLHFDADILKSIRDNTVGVRSSESETFYAMLAKARDTSNEEFERAGESQVPYAVLMTNPENFRGKLLTIEGTVKRLSQFAASENEAGFERLSEAWLLTADSYDNPYRVVFTNAPSKEFQGNLDGLERRVRVTGYFFKRQGYSAQHGLHTAPLLLAQRLIPLKPTPTVVPESSLSWPLAAAAVVALMLLVAIVWRIAIGDKQFTRRYRKQLRAAAQEPLNIAPEDVSEDAGPF